MTLEISQKITYKSMNENRRYFYVVILFLSACLTDSPNYISQLTVAVPTIFFFEVFIFMMRKYKIVIFYNFQDK